jgi:Integrase core domain
LGTFFNNRGDLSVNKLHSSNRVPREDEFGFKYVIAIIDCFCRFIELFAVKDLSAISTAKCLLQWVSLYGFPSTILSDNGTQHVNQIIDEFIERVNKEVLRHLRAKLSSTFTFSATHI